MSAKSQLKAQGKERMKKRQMRHLKRKRNSSYMGIEQDSGDEWENIGFLKIPAGKKNKATKRTNAGVSTSSINTDEIPVDVESSVSFNLPPPNFSDFPIMKKLWSGLPGEVEPSEALKNSRKSIGVVVRGSLINCPPPIESIQDSHLPPHFPQLFAHLHILYPSSVQKQCWPALLNGANLLALSPTGSGKTLSFILPLVTHVVTQIKSDIFKKQLFSNSNERTVRPVGLVLVPTRELAIQVTVAAKPLKRFIEVKCAAVYGGRDKEEQYEEMRSAHILVATPGRLLDFIANGKLVSLSHVTMLVIDEADRMLAMGFMEQMDMITNQIRPDRQTALFSATFPGKLREVAQSWLFDPITIRCHTTEYRKDSSGRVTGSVESAQRSLPIDNQDHSTCNDSLNDLKGKVSAQELSETVRTSMMSVSKTVVQKVHVCASHKKPRLLMKFLASARLKEKEENVRQPGSMIIFCNKIITLHFVYKFLVKETVRCEMLHGQLDQKTRDSVLHDFKAGKIHTLVSTDVAARGIHIKRLAYVVNYDFPSNIEQYCHRVGRTGRQGATGMAYSLITRQLAPLCGDLITLLKECEQEVEPNLVALHNDFIFRGIVTGDSDEEEANNALKDA